MFYFIVVSHGLVRPEARFQNRASSHNSEEKKGSSDAQDALGMSNIEVGATVSNADRIEGD